MISKWLLAVLLLFAGVMHLIKPGFFLKIMPPYLPPHLELVPAASKSLLIVTADADIRLWNDAAKHFNRDAKRNWIYSKSA
jgi:uncharacterized membrane protein